MRSRITGVLTKVTTAIVCTAMMLWLPARQSSARVVLVDQLTKSVVDREAAKYTRAVNDLGGIANLTLKTESDFKTASSLINQQTENLRFVKYRMVQIALSNSGFVAAVERELGKARGNEDAVLRSFRQNPGTLASLNGGRSAQQSIRAELTRDFQKIKSASEHLGNAASSIMNRRGSAPAQDSGQAAYARIGYNASPVVDNLFEALFAASTLVAAARTGAGPLTKLPRSGASGPSGGSSGGSSGGTDCIITACWVQDEEKYHECARDAGQKRDRCKDDCPAPGLFQWVCLANCDGSYMLTKAACVINSMNQY